MKDGKASIPRGAFLALPGEICVTPPFSKFIACLRISNPVFDDFRHALPDGFTA